ncbi:unnamed protein product [Arctogadus glacialis]
MLIGRDVGKAVPVSTVLVPAGGSDKSCHHQGIWAKNTGAIDDSAEKGAQARQRPLRRRMPAAAAATAADSRDGLEETPVSGLP